MAVAIVAAFQLALELLVAGASASREELAMQHRSHLLNAAPLNAALALLTTIACTAAEPAAPPTRADAANARTDLHGDPLPPGAVARLGTVRFRHASYVYWSRFGPDNRTLASFEREGIVRVWDTDSGCERMHVALQEVDDTIDRGADMSNGGRLIVTWNGGSNIQVWDITVHKLVRTLTTDGTLVRDAEVAPSGDYVAAVGFRPNTHQRTLFLWDVRTGERQWDSAISLPDQWDWPSVEVFLSFQGHGRRVLINLRNDSKRDSEVVLRLWDVASGKQLTTLADKPHKYPGCTISPDGNSLAVHNGGLKLIDIASGKEIRRFGPLQGSELVAVRFSPNGHALAAFTGKATIDLHADIWDIASGKRLPSPHRSDMIIDGAAFSPNGRFLAIEEIDGCGIEIYNSDTGELVHEFDTHSLQDETGRQTGPSFGPRVLGSVRAVFSPDERLLAVAPDSSTIRLWDVATGKERVIVPAAHTATVQDIAVSPDGRLLVSGGYDGTLRFWDAGGRQIRSVTLPGMGEGRPPNFTWGNECRIAFAPDGKKVAASSAFSFIGVWEARTGKLLKRFSDGGGAASLIYSRDGCRLYTGDRARVRCWDSTSAKMLQEFHPPNLLPRSRGREFEERQVVALSPDDRYLAATCGRRGGADYKYNYGCMLCLWELSTGKLCRQWTSVGARFDCTPLVQFSPDGKTILWNAVDSLELLDLRAGKRLRHFGCSDDLVAATFAPSGETLAVLFKRLLRVIDPSTGTILAEVAPEQGSFSCLCFAPDSKRLFTGQADSSITCWDVQQLREMWTRSARLGTQGGR